MRTTTRSVWTLGGMVLLLTSTAVPAVGHDTGGRSGPAVVRDARWYLRDSLTPGVADDVLDYGRAGDVPVMGDWNGAGRQTPGVFRDGTWYLDDDYRGGTSRITVALGQPGDTPVVGDWDGDGADEVGVHRGATWLLDSDLDGTPEHEVVYGRSGDQPLVGDWDGDGRSTLGVRRGATLHLTDELVGGGADHTFTYGRTSDVPVVGRWTQGEHDHVGVVRGDRWLLRDELAGGPADRRFRYGRAGDVPLTWRAEPDPEVTWSYFVGPDGEPQADLARFAEVAARSLADERGWALGGSIAFVRVSDQGAADLRLWLTDDDDVGDRAPGCSDEWSCRVGDDVYINDQNWNQGTATWQERELYDYRRYVIQHEVGHWLELDHRNDPDDCAADGAAPVMMQQSIDLRGCETNIWPLPFERDLVRDRHLE